MVVAFVLTNAYAHVKGRLNFILQLMSHVEDLNCMIVCNEYYMKHFSLIVDGTEDRFYYELEMRKLSEEKIKNIDFCFVPDNVLYSDICEGSSRTKTLSLLYEKGVPSAETYVIEAIKHCLKKRGDASVDFFLNHVETMCFERNVAKYFEVPIIPYSFAPIKKVHGYPLTLYNAHIGDIIYTCEYAKNGYKDFSDSDMPFPILNKKELLALIGKKRNLPLLPLVDCEGVFEIGVAAQSDSIIPQTFSKEWVVDEDIYYDAQKRYSTSDIQTRLHPNKAERIGIGKNHYQNDPISFILSSKIVATVQSQLSLKAALWNRNVCTYTEEIPYSFIFKHDIEHADRVSDSMLNYILFGYLVPSTLMFSREYWIWRISRPSMKEVILRNINAILSEIGFLSSELLETNNRLQRILELRGCTQSEIVTATTKVDLAEIDYRFILSRIKIRNHNAVSDYFCLNKTNTEGSILSVFIFDQDVTADKIMFLPLNDVDGFAKLLDVSINGESIYKQKTMQFLNKGKGIDIPCSQKGISIIRILWEGSRFFDYYK